MIKIDIDILEIAEMIQLEELYMADLITDKMWVRRLQYLQTKYDGVDIDLSSLSAAKSVIDLTGLLQKQKCSNSECGYVFYSEDVSETCDICYHTTLRIQK